MHCGAMIDIHNNVITHCDIALVVLSNTYNSHSDFTIGIPCNIMTHCDVIMSGTAYWLMSTDRIELHSENTYNYMYIT